MFNKKGDEEFARFTCALNENDKIQKARANKIIPNISRFIYCFKIFFTAIIFPSFTNCK